MKNNSTNGNDSTTGNYRNNSKNSKDDIVRVITVLIKVKYQ